MCGAHWQHTRPLQALLHRPCQRDTHINQPPSNDLLRSMLPGLRSATPTFWRRSGRCGSTWGAPRRRRRAWCCGGRFGHRHGQGECAGRLVNSRGALKLARQ